MIKRRRMQNKTDYKLRLNLLKSDKMRLVVRKSNRYFIAQIVQTDIAQDKVLLTVSSFDLIALGWPNEKKGSLKSRPAAYLTGYLIGKKSKSFVKNAIVDMGMNRNIHSSRIFALLKGVKEAGLNIALDEKVLPSVELLITKNITQNTIDKIKEKI